MTGQFKTYTEHQLAAIAGEDRIVWVGFPSSHRFLCEQWIAGLTPDRRPQIENLVAYSVAGPSSPSRGASRRWSRRAWTFAPIWLSYPQGKIPPGSVDPSSVEAGKPCRRAEGAAR